MSASAHAPGVHDDIANAVGGALTLAVGKPRAMVISDELLERAACLSRRFVDYRFPPTFSKPEGISDETITNP
jgi:hypothetical protein